jgi:hypothetical protein
MDQVTALRTLLVMKTPYPATKKELEAKKVVDLMPTPIRIRVNGQTVTLHPNY